MKFSYLVSLFFGILLVPLASGQKIIEQDVEFKSPALIQAGGMFKSRSAYCQAADGRIVIEGETGSSFILQDASKPLQSFGSDSNASMQGYAAFLKQAEYEIAIDKELDLTAWHRRWFPQAGYWNHTEQMDSDKPVEVYDMKGGEPQDRAVRNWTWQKGATYKFKKGKHSFKLDWQGGVRLDQIAFLPSGIVPDGNGMMFPTFAVPLSQLAVSSLPFTWQDGQTPVAFKLEKIELNGGRAEFSLSLDKGTTWEAVTPGKTFAEQQIKLPASGTLIVKAELSRPDNANAALPVFYNPVWAMRSNSPLKAKLAIAEKFFPKITSIDLIPDCYQGLIYSSGQWKMPEQAVPDSRGILVFNLDRSANCELAPREDSFFEKSPDSLSREVLYNGILNRNLVSFNFKMNEAAMAVPWFRVKLQRPGYMTTEQFGFKTNYRPIVSFQFDRNGIVNLDFSQVKDFPDEQFRSGEWLWLKGNPVMVGSGNQTLRFRGGLDYCYLDTIVLAPMGSAQLPEKLVPEYRRGTSAEVIFQPIDLKIFTPEQAVADGNSAAKNAGKWSVSFDGGAWKTYPCEIPPNSVVMRLKYSVNGNDVTISGWSLKVKTGLEQIVCIGNSEQEIFIQPDAAAVIGWRSFSSGWLKPLGSGKSLLSFSMGDRKSGFKGKTVNGFLTGGRIVENTDAKTLALDYNPASGVDATVRISLKQHGLPEWNYAINNKSHEDIRSLEFPLIENIRLGNNPETNYAVAPFAHGAADFPGMPLGILQSGTPSPKTSGVYPGFITMGWYCIYADKLGCFTGQVRDTDSIGTKITMEKSTDSSAVDTNFERRTVIEAGKSGSGTYAVGWLPGTWYQAADQYSGWAHSWMDFSRVNSNWSKNAHGWASGWRFVSAYPASRRVTHLAPELEWIGCNYFQLFGGGVEPEVWSASTFPIVNPRLGTVAELQAAGHAVKSHGIRQTYYWNTRGWSPSHEDTDKIGFFPKKQLPACIRIPEKGFADANSIKGEAGLAESYGFIPNGVSMDAGAKGWQNYMVEGFSDNYCRNGGADGVYWDEGFADYECYNDRHEHGRQYSTSAKYRGETFRRSLDKARSFNPDAVIAMEGNCDVLMQYVDFGLWVMTPYCDGSLFMYAFPEAKLLRGECNPLNRWFMGNEEYVRFINLFLRMDSVDFSKNTRKFFQHRGRIGDWMYNGRFMDSRDLTVSEPGIRAKWFLRNQPDGVGAVINVQNEFERKNATLTLAELPFKQAYAYAFMLEEETVKQLKFESDKNLIKVPVPSEKASTIILIKPDSTTQPLGCLVWRRKYPADTMDLYLINPASTSRQFKLQWSIPEAIKTDSLPAEVTLTGGELKKMTVQLKGIDQMDSRAAVKVTLVDSNVKKEISCILTPPIYNRSFEQDSAGRGTPDGWRAQGHEWYTHLLVNSELPIKLEQADGVLDNAFAASGKQSLRLDGQIKLPNYWTDYLFKRKDAPLENWIYSTGQRLILRPGCKYAVSIKYRSANSDGALLIKSVPYASSPSVFPVQTVNYSVPGEWHNFKYEFSVPDDVDECYLIFANNSSGAVWLDDIQVNCIGNAEKIPARPVLSGGKNKPAAIMTKPVPAVPIKPQDSELEKRILKEKRLGVWGTYGPAVAEIGLGLLKETSEGSIKLERGGGKDAAVLRVKDFPGWMCAYVKVANEMLQLLESESELYLEYFDGIEGNMVIRHSVSGSADLTEIGKVKLNATGKWKIVSFPVPAHTPKSDWNFQVVVYNPAGQLPIKAVALLKQQK